MFAKQGTGQQIEWSVISLATRVVRESGRAATLQDCMAQAGEGEDVFIGQALPAGSVVAPDGTSKPPQPNNPQPTVADVKAFASKQLGYTDWYVTRSMEPDGKAIPDDIIKIRNRIRERAAALEAMVPIPGNFRDPQFWN